MGILDPRGMFGRAGLDLGLATLEQVAFPCGDACLEERIPLVVKVWDLYTTNLPVISRNT